MEPLDVSPSEAVVQASSQPEFTYLGELEVAAYSSDGKDLTYSGELPVKGRTAAGMLSVFKIGDTVLIDGDTYVIEDKVDEAAREKLTAMRRRCSLAGKPALCTDIPTGL